MAQSSDPKRSANDITGQDHGKVGLKGILKSGTPQSHAVRPAAMEGFQVADFHRDTQSRVRKEDASQLEIRKLEGQLAQAKSEIAQLKDKLTKETESARGQGYQEGHFKGLAEGEKNAEEVWTAQIELIRKDVAENLEQIAQQQNQRFEELQNACVELAIGLAKKIYCYESQQSKTLISQVLAEAFQYLGQEEKLRVRINPLDLVLAEKAESFWRPIASNVQSLELVADPSIDRGGCLIESEKGGSIDRRTQTALNNLEESIRTAYQQSKATS